jgi:hypothetical protein
MSQKNNDPDIQGLTNIIQNVIISPIVAETVRRIAEIRMQIFDLQEELANAEASLSGHIETAITTPKEE